MKILTFNVRNSLAEDGENCWTHRAETVSRFLDENAADVICLQEATPQILLDLCHKMQKGYHFVGVGRLAGPDYAANGKLCSLGDVFEAVLEAVDFDEFNPILFDPDKLELKESGTFWLSEHPGIPRTMFSGQHPLLPRICTWAHLRDKQTGKELAVFNTHLDHMNEQIRLKQAGVILVKLTSFTAGNPAVPIVLAGDFNTRPDGEVYAKLVGSDIPLHDLTSTVPWSFHNFGERDKDEGKTESDMLEKIDYIFSSQPYAASVQTHNKREGRYLSDHIAIEAVFDVD